MFLGGGDILDVPSRPRVPATYALFLLLERLLTSRLKATAPRLEATLLGWRPSPVGPYYHDSPHMVIVHRQHSADSKRQPVFVGYSWRSKAPVQCETRVERKARCIRIWNIGERAVETTPGREQAEDALRRPTNEHRCNTDFPRSVHSAFSPTGCNSKTLTGHLGPQKNDEKRLTSWSQ